MACSACRPHGLDAREVRAALSRVLSSVAFRSSHQLCSFLRFVVEATLDGRGDRLKGYTIGVEALGRSESFDPQSDPIVRVEAIRLRRALGRYYAGEGAADPIVIELLRGSYVPMFRGRAAAANWMRALRAIQRVLHTRLILLAPGDQR